MRMLKAMLLGCVLSLLACTLPATETRPTTMHVYIGTYTGKDSQGIYLMDLDTEKGTLSEPRLAGKATNPSFLALHPKGNFLYACSEVDSVDGKKGGGVAAFSIDASSGQLTELNRQSSMGSGPCHVTVDATGKTLLVANYSSGSVASLPIEASGKLKPAASSHQHKGSSVNKQRQQGPHAHSFNIDKGNRFAFAADLGTDEIRIYRLKAEEGTITPSDPIAVKSVEGGGPRHFAFHPNGKQAFTNNELTSSITSFSYDSEKGTLTQIETLTTLPEGYDGKNNTTAEVAVAPSGKFVYVSNRGHDSIAIFSISDEGKLKAQGHVSTEGKTPRNFGIDPSGKFLIACNQSTNNVVLFRLGEDGKPVAVKGQAYKVGAPVCVKFLQK